MTTQNRLLNNAKKLGDQILINRVQNGYYGIRNNICFNDVRNFFEDISYSLYWEGPQWLRPDNDYDDCIHDPDALCRSCPYPNSC